MFGKFEVLGLQQLLKRIEKLSDGTSTASIREVMQEVVDYAFSKLPPYPPPLQGQRYVRTMNLQDSLFKAVRGLTKEVEGVIGSDLVKAPYSPYVISNEVIDGAGPQAKIHQGRWYTLQGHISNVREGVINILRKYLDKIVG